jgi:ERF superfamily
MARLDSRGPQYQHLGEGYMSNLQVVDTDMQSETSSIISMIARAASDPSVSLDKMERLFAMHQQMEQTQAQKAYNAAMAIAQAEIGPVFRNRKNEHTKSRYAELEAIDGAIRPIYTTHGFSLSFDTEEEGSHVKVFCDVMHSGGFIKRHTLKSTLDNVGMNGQKNKTDIQGLGSSVSYLRRYLTLMIFNVTMKNEDTDGNETAKLITAMQFEELLVKLDLVDGDKVKFAEVLKVPSLAELPAARFDAALRVIEQRAAKLAQERASKNAV